MLAQTNRVASCGPHSPLALARLPGLAERPERNPEQSQVLNEELPRDHRMAVCRFGLRDLPDDQYLRTAEPRPENRSHGIPPSFDLGRSHDVLAWAATRCIASTCVG